MVSSMSKQSLASASTAGRSTTKDVYQGVVKWARGAIAWVVCTALQAKFPGQDVFIHKSKCAGEAVPRQGETVSFTLMQDELGRPQAARAWSTPTPLMISAKDWFAERARSSR